MNTQEQIAEFLGGVSVGIERLINDVAVARYKAALQSILGVEFSDTRPVAPKTIANRRILAGGPKKPRRKGPIQLCPSPGCKGRAAPVYGMLCAKHRGTGKRIVAKWREARRSKKAK